MFHHFLLAGFLLATSSSTETAPPVIAKLTDAETISLQAGGILGAAAACTSIDRDRISVVTEKVADLVSAAASDYDELGSAQEIFADSALAGQQAVQTGKTDCQDVATALDELEGAVKQTAAGIAT
jgi:hypothetical protein